MKAISCGFLIKHNNKFLAMLPTGRQDKFHSYDIPKGHMEEGETYLETALRELKEESGIELDKTEHHAIVDLGMFNYRPEKNLYLFYVEITKFPDDFEMTYNATFIDVDGVEKKEMCGHKWINDFRYYFKSLQKIIVDLQILKE